MKPRRSNEASPFLGDRFKLAEVIEESVQMQSWSEREARQFLVDKICHESEGEGAPLSDLERRLLMFSVAEPGTAKGIPDEVLNDIDPDWEARMTALLHNAYDRDRDDPEQRQGYLDAMLRLKDSDHYILAIAEQVFSMPCHGHFDPQTCFICCGWRHCPDRDRVPDSLEG
jgi:hypothetical protein